MGTKKINYIITFLSDWHAGSGLSSGADADSVVIKDKNNLPYLPGKTIKGLLKDVFEDFKDAQPSLINDEFIKSYFGKYIKERKESHKGLLFFSNAELNELEKSEISKDMSNLLYRNIASTKIGKNGVAEKGSLRTMQVCVPVVLEGYIDGVLETDVEKFEKALKCIRHLGANRNRGLGRCKLEIKIN
ncbi:MAG: RAMP superfamily CRISPR-associated protein [Patescibacteria group bacterium]|nr:RAMP superfamily CRISPR-associated protein [Patescibacteria group bacterium]